MWVAERPVESTIQGLNDKLAVRLAELLLYRHSEAHISEADCERLRHKQPLWQMPEITASKVRMWLRGVSVPSSVGCRAGYLLENVTPCPQRKAHDALVFALGGLLSAACIYLPPNHQEAVDRLFSCMAKLYIPWSTPEVRACLRSPYI